jgi:hypothetical protein
VLLKGRLDVQGETEVYQFAAQVGIYQDVLRLYVAVNYFLPVEGAQAL